MQTSRGRTVREPKPVYVPSEDFYDDEGGDDGESLGDEEEDEEEEEDEDTDLSGFIVADGEGEEESDAEYSPSQDDEEEDETETETEDDEDAQGPRAVTRGNLIRSVLRFVKEQGLPSDTETPEVLARMVERGYRFPFLRESMQLRLVSHYVSGTRPPLTLVMEAFDL